MVDNKVIDKKFYTVKSGSTVVTLSKDYTSTLSAENHTLSIVSEEGSATALFKVNKKVIASESNNESSKPKTPSKPSVKETPKAKDSSKPGIEKEIPKNKERMSPKTSDTTSTMGFMLISLISLFVLYFGKKQKA